MSPLLTTEQVAELLSVDAGEHEAAKTVAAAEAQIESLALHLDKTVATAADAVKRAAQAERRVVQLENALIALNAAIDGMWNTGLSEQHKKEITHAQQLSRFAVEGL